jgi:hypothetical protein
VVERPSNNEIRCDVVAAKVAQLDGTRVVTAAVDPSPSEHEQYVYQGAQHVTSGLQLHADSSGVTQLGESVTGGGSGDTVPPDRRTALVRAHPVNPDAVDRIHAELSAPHRVIAP